MKYLRIGLVLLILAVLVLATSACITKSPTQEKADENSVNNSINDTTQFTGYNDTDNRSVDPVSIPLEKPPFID
jgi:hypothetical protein